MVHERRCEGACLLGGREVARSPRVAGKGGVPLYHQTSPEIAAMIMRTGFKPGSAGWCARRMQRQGGQTQWPSRLAGKASATCRPPGLLSASVHMRGLGRRESAATNDAR